MVFAGELGEGRAFSSVAEAIMAHDQHSVSLQAKVKIRIKGETVETTIGRAIFNEALPTDFPFVDHDVTKKALGAIVDKLAEFYPKVTVSEIGRAHV